MVTRTRIAYPLIALLAAAPFLQPIHRLPLPSFYEEWLAVLLGLLAVTAVASARGVVMLPSAALAPLALALVALIQWLTGLAEIGEFVAVHVVYLAWAGLLATAAASLVNRDGRQAMFQVLATAILFGSLLSVVLVLLQRWQVRLPLEIMFPAGSRLVANVAQPNELTSYLLLGLLATAYLWRANHLSWRTAVLLSVVIAGATGMASSRMALLQAGAIAALLAVLLQQEHSRAARVAQGKLLLVCLLAGGAVPAMIDLVAPPRLAGSAAEHSVLDRLSVLGLRGDARLDLWRDTATLIADHPLAGNGAGNYSWRMVDAASRAPAGAQTYPGAEHAHNMFLQLAADFGLPVTVLLASALLWWLIRFARHGVSGATENPERDFGVGVLVVFGIHSLLEYPLWHAECLGLVFLVAGALDPVTRRLQRAPNRGLAALVATAMTAMLVSIFFDYRTIDAAANRPLDATEAGWRKRVDSVVHLAKTSPLKPYAYVALAALMTPEAAHAADQSVICEQAMQVWPDPLIITKCAILRCMTGRSEDARQLVTSLRAAFRDPERQAVIKEGIEVFAKKNPGAGSLGVCGLDETGGISSRQGP